MFRDQKPDVDGSDLTFKYEISLSTFKFFNSKENETFERCSILPAQ